MVWPRNRPKIKHKNFSWKKLDLSKKIPHEKLDRAYKDITCLIHIGAYVPKSQNTTKQNTLNKINVDASLSLAKSFSNALTSPKAPRPDRLTIDGSK